MGMLLKLIARHFVDRNSELNKNNLCEEHNITELAKGVW